MSELVRFNKIGWVVVGLGVALSLWQAGSCTDGGGSCSSEDSVGIFLAYACLAIGGGLFISILSNEVKEEVLWKRIMAALTIGVVTIALWLALSLSRKLPLRT